MKKEMLRDGIVLRRLMDDFQKQKNEDTLFRILVCLKDSTVYVPCVRFTGKGDVVTTIDGISYAFQPFSKGNQEYAALFTNLEQMKELDSSFVKMEVEFLEIFKYIQVKSFVGIVLDPMTNSLVIPNSLFEIMKKI
ncbi:MAG: SseB family protein [Bacillota bacterium]|nr:SseB family protein [Bacillota bacterium]